MHRRVVFVCVSSTIFPNSNESAKKKTYGSPQHCNRLIYNMGFFIKQPLHADTEFEWQPYCRNYRPFCLPLQAPERISIHVVLLLQALPLCLVRHYIAHVHVHIFITGICTWKCCCNGWHHIQAGSCLLLLHRLIPIKENHMQSLSDVCICWW